MLALFITVYGDFTPKIEPMIAVSWPGDCTNCFPTSHHSGSIKAKKVNFSMARALAEARCSSKVLSLIPLTHLETNQFRVSGGGSLTEVSAFGSASIETSLDQSKGMLSEGVGSDSPKMLDTQALSQGNFRPCKLAFAREALESALLLSKVDATPPTSMWLNWAEELGSMLGCSIDGTASSDSSSTIFSSRSKAAKALEAASCLGEKVGAPSASKSTSTRPLARFRAFHLFLMPCGSTSRSSSASESMAHPLA